MVVSQGKFSDVQFGADFKTLPQLRTGSNPNAWESAWAVFDHTDDEHFYYVAFKPNGWELGKVDPGYPSAQRYLATSTDSKFDVGTQHHFDIQQNGATITVNVDGHPLTTFTDNERPYLSGAYSFCTEDARVAYDNVTGPVSDDFESHPVQTFTDGEKLGSAWKTMYVGYGHGEIADLGGGTTAPNPAPVSTEAEVTTTETAGDPVPMSDTRGNALHGQHHTFDWN